MHWTGKAINPNKNCSHVRQLWRIIPAIYVDLEQLLTLTC